MQAVITKRTRATVTIPDISAALAAAVVAVGGTVSATILHDRYEGSESGFYELYVKFEPSPTDEFRNDLAKALLEADPDGDFPDDGQPFFQTDTDLDEDRATLVSWIRHQRTLNPNLTIESVDAPREPVEQGGATLPAAL